MRAHGPQRLPGNGRDGHAHSALPALLRKIPEPLLERIVLPRLLTPQLLSDPAAAALFRDVLTPRPDIGGQASPASTQLGLMGLAMYRRTVLPFYLDCLTKRLGAVRIGLLINLPRAAHALPPDALRRTIFADIKLGLQDVDDELRVRSFAGLCALVPLVLRFA